MPTFYYFLQFYTNGSFLQFCCTVVGLQPIELLLLLGVLLEPAERPLSGVVGGRITSLATKSVVHVHRISVPHVIGERI